MLYTTHMETRQIKNHIGQKHLVRPDGCQLELVQGQKSGPKEVEGNCGCPLSPWDTEESEE